MPLWLLSACCQAVWEELPGDAEYGRRTKEQKQRAFSQLVTPENPVYLHGYADSSSDIDMKLPTISGGCLCCQDAVSIFNATEHLSDRCKSASTYHILSLAHMQLSLVE
jgi:hypothetical protein